MLRYLTAGESHGEALVAILSGLPAGLPVDGGFLDRELWRRQQGYGRGGRMSIERDHAQILSGVRQGATIGTPVSLLIANRDWENWREALPVQAGDQTKHRPLSSPRPGHGDLAGALKYDLPEARFVLERTSARESAARVALGALAKLLLLEMGIEVASHTLAVGKAQIQQQVPWEEIALLSKRDEVVLNCPDSTSEMQMKAQVDDALQRGDSVGGIFEVVAHGVPPGLGGYSQWNDRLDSKLAAALMSVPAVKAVEIGTGVSNATSFGSSVHDEISHNKESETSFAGFTRGTNRAGGIEAGVSNGEEIRIRGYLKPISTLRTPLSSVDFGSRTEVKASYERSDVCVVPAAGVIGEAVVALTLAGCALVKFGGDSVREFCRNYAGYVEQLKRF
ncbi:MAG: chorismate synthase [Acidobacteriales bacterium]|nr:chorismate synthase [Terriglobales bacterium]